MYSLIIVDDEDITRMAINSYLQKTQPDFKVEGTFANGSDAMNFLKNHPVNIVITDIRMPGIDGLKLTEYVSEQYPSTIILIVSGYGEFEYARKAMRYGVSNYLLKPLDFSELSSSLANAKERLDALHMETNVQEEDIQLFFTDLIGGMLIDKVELNKKFRDLSLSGEISDYKGCLLTITLNKNDTITQWQYGREKLAVALLNGIRMVLTNYQCYHLFRSGMRYFFIILSHEKVPDISIEMLNGILFNLLHFSCDIKIQNTFVNIEELCSFPTVNIEKESLTDYSTNLEDKTDTTYLSSSVTPTSSDSDNIIIQRAMTYIQTHYAEDLTREDVADAVFLSSAYFSRFFKQRVGMSFIDYLTTIRMQKAAQLLTTKMKVYDIAKKVGYQSRNRFFINFRQYSGYTPTEYRIQILKMEDTSEEIE